MIHLAHPQPRPVGIIIFKYILSVPNFQGLANLRSEIKIFTTGGTGRVDH